MLEELPNWCYREPVRIRTSDHRQSEERDKRDRSEGWDLAFLQGVEKDYSQRGEQTPCKERERWWDLLGIRGV